MSGKDQFFRFIGKVTIGVLILCLSLALAIFALGRLFSVGDDYYINLYPSPSGHMKAALVTRSGGGAISPYCTETLTVVPSSASEIEMAAEKFEVYSTDCDTFADHSASPTVEWISNEMLRISFSINGTAVSMRTVQLKKQDLSGRILIEFTARQ